MIKRNRSHVTNDCSFLRSRPPFSHFCRQAALLAFATIAVVYAAAGEPCGLFDIGPANKKREDMGLKCPVRRKF